MGTVTSLTDHPPDPSKFHPAAENNSEAELTGSG
jgi:hypothetical protein